MEVKKDIVIDLESSDENDEIKTVSSFNDSDEKLKTLTYEHLCEMLPADVNEIIQRSLEIRLLNETNIPKRFIFGRQIASALPSE